MLNNLSENLGINCRSGLRQLDLLEEEGVAANRVLIGHTGDTDDLIYILAVLSRGAFIGMDRYGNPSRCTTERRNATVIELAKRGFSNRMFLSQDYCCAMDWFPEVEMELKYPDRSMSYIMQKVLPELRKQGVTEEQINDMMSRNVQHWLTGLAI